MNRPYPNILTIAEAITNEIILEKTLPQKTVNTGNEELEPSGIPRVSAFPVGLEDWEQGGTEAGTSTDVDWRSRFEGRAAILQFDGGLSRSEAERQAFEMMTVLWINENPPISIDSDVCPGCALPIGEVGVESVPFLVGEGRHVWLHHSCHVKWMQRRREEARSILTSIVKYGICEDE